MKPLYHPSAKDITVEGVLYALSDPIRVRIYSDIAKSECSKTCSAFLEMNEKPLPKSTLSQHFKILREAGLIRSVRKGVEMHSITRCAELKDRFGNMVSSIIQAYNDQNKKAKRKSA
jgi:DNA-binding transcriptional ArsR family regulator